MSYREQFEHRSTDELLGYLRLDLADDAKPVLLRVLAARVEPAMDLLRQAWLRWRAQAWGLAAPMPRVWRT